MDDSSAADLFCVGISDACSSLPIELVIELVI
jgi:hypothetical protein